MYCRALFHVRASQLSIGRSPKNRDMSWGGDAHVRFRIFKFSMVGFPLGDDHFLLCFHAKRLRQNDVRIQ